MKTYIIDWYNKTRNGALRNYRNVVQTDDIGSYVRDKMKLVVGCMAFGQYKGIFSNATEVCKTDKLGYDYQTVNGGEYLYTKDGQIKFGTCKWRRLYDYKLKCWMIQQVNSKIRQAQHEDYFQKYLCKLVLVCYNIGTMNERIKQNALRPQLE